MLPAVEPKTGRTTNEASTNVMCFDIFDTLLTRAVANPEDVFLLLGQRLWKSGAIPCSPEMFARQRVYAEERASLCSGTHPTLNGIYRELVPSLGLPELALESLMSEELQLEAELSRKVSGADALLKAARERSDSVAFLTDTNFSADYLRNLLADRGIWEDGDRIFASCEIGVDKGRGTMFPFVARELGSKPWDFVHHGNDSIADLRNGRFSGWNVRHISETKLNRYEQALAAESLATGGLASLMAGASRLARLSLPATNDRDRILYDVAASVMAPTLTAWVLWIMRRATQKGHKRVYFISRDGQVLLDIAQRLERVIETGLDLRYLYGSRQAVQLAGSPDDALRDIMRLGTCRVRDLRELLGVAPERLVAVLPPGFADTSRWNRNLTPAERKELSEGFGGAKFGELICERSAQTRTMLVDYLRQESWGEDVSFALVDVGWRASMAGALSTLLENEAINQPDSYLFFGLGDDAHRVAGPLAWPRLESWFFDDASKHGYLPYPPSTTSMIEMFCAADHGSVIGFERRAEKICPVLGTAESPMQGWGLPLLRQATAAYVDNLAESLSPGGLVDPYVDVRRGLREVLRLFWNDPAPQEAKYWGSFPVEVNLNNSCVRHLAEPVRATDIVRSIMDGRLELRPQHSWPRGTALVSAWPYRAMFWCIEGLRSKLPRLRSRMRWLGAQILSTTKRRITRQPNASAPI